MKIIWFIIYNVIVLPLLWLVIMTFGLFKQKFHIGIVGRKNLFSNLQSQLAKLNSGSKRIWFHVSSLGEFEQAKPIISKLKTSHPEYKIIVSFFSPSGYEPSKKYKLADAITYIPFDSYWNAKKFIRLLNPVVAIMVRYDLWPNHIWELKKQRIPLLITNASMSRDTIRMYPILKSFHRMIYNEADYILTVGKNDIEVFKIFKLDHPKFEAIGDTRFDQVMLRSIESKKKHLIPANITEGKKIFVVGSSWEADEEVLFPVFYQLQNIIPNILMVIAPHEPTNHNLDRIEYELNSNTTYIRFSDLNDYNGEKIILVDSIGVLMALYQYADVAFVGGSFKSKIHNVLEPAVYGIPVVFGPHFANSSEATLLLNEGAGFSGKNETEIFEILKNLFLHEEFRLQAGAKANQFVKKNLGATDKFINYFEKLL